MLAPAPPLARTKRKPTTSLPKVMSGMPPETVVRTPPQTVPASLNSCTTPLALLSTTKVFVVLAPSTTKVCVVLAPSTVSPSDTTVPVTSMPVLVVASLELLSYIR